MLATMTAEQVALYGGAIWLGPLFLAGFIGLYIFWSGGPWTRRGREKYRLDKARWEARRRQRFPEAFKDDPSHQGKSERGTRGS